MSGASIIAERGSATRSGLGDRKSQRFGGPCVLPSVLRLIEPRSIWATCLSVHYFVRNAKKKCVGPSFRALSARMSYIANMRSWTILVTVALLGWGAAWGGGATKPITAEEIINNTVSKSGARAGENGRANYTYTKISITDELDSRGEVEERKEKVIRFRRGKGSVVQIKMNGRALSPEELRREQQQIIEEDAKVSESKMSRRSDN